MIVAKAAATSATGRKRRQAGCPGRTDPVDSARRRRSVRTPPAGRRPATAPG